MIDETVKIYPNVRLGNNPIVESFSILGIRPGGKANGGQETVIGDNAVVRSHAVIYAGNSIGSAFCTGNKVNIRESNSIGDNVSVGTLSVVEHHVTIGNNVRIHSQVFIPEYTVLEDGCWIGPNVVFTNAKYPNRPDTKSKLAGPVVEAGAVIGANVTVLPGVRIGAGSIVGAGSVVTRDVKPGVIVYGSPALPHRRNPTTC